MKQMKRLITTAELQGLLNHQKQLALSNECKVTPSARGHVKEPVTINTSKNTETHFYIDMGQFVGEHTF